MKTKKWREREFYVMLVGGIIAILGMCGKLTPEAIEGIDTELNSLIDPVFRIVSLYIGGMTAKGFQEARGAAKSNGN